MSLVLFAQEITRVEQDEQYKTAIKFEQSGEYQKAINIYKILFKLQPNNQTYYTHLKNNLLIVKEYDKTIEIIEKWNTKHKLNNEDEIELGALYYYKQRIDDANLIWKKLLKNRRNKEYNADLIFRYSIKYNLFEHLDDIVKFIRKEVNDENILTLPLASFLINRQNWTELANEIIHYFENNGKQIDGIKNKLYEIELKKEFFPILIDNLIDRKNDEAIGVDIRLLLSNLYFNISQYDEAIDILINSSKYLKIPFKELKNLAFQLHNIKEYEHSIRTINYFLKHSKNSKDISQMLLLIGKNYEMNFRKKSTLINIVKSPFENKFTKIEFTYNLTEKNNQLQKALSIYDSLSTYSKISSLKAEAYYQIGEIRFNILNDFDNALSDYFKSLNKIKREKRIVVLNRIVDVHIAKGDRQNAQKFIKDAPMKYKLTVKEEDELMLKQNQLDYLFGTTDSLQKNILTSLALIGEYHNLYNDLLNFRFLFETLQKDSDSLEDFLLAERYLHQNRLIEAKLILEKMLEQNSEINPIISMRYITILRIMNETDVENIFWNKYKDKLIQTNYGDYFMIKYGEFLEYFLNEKDNAETVYTNILINYSDSPYFDSVRLHLRGLIENNY